MKPEQDKLAELKHARDEAEKVMREAIALRDDAAAELRLAEKAFFKAERAWLKECDRLV